MGVFLFSTLFSGLNATAQGNWELQGNAISATDFIGSTNDEDVNFKTNDQKRLIIKNDGTVGIGTVEPKGMFEILYCPPPLISLPGLIVTQEECIVPVVFDPNTAIELIINPFFANWLQPNEDEIKVALNYKTGHTSKIGNPTFNSESPLMWARTLGSSGWTFSMPDDYNTKFIVMPDGSCGINIAQPRAALDVRGSNGPNYPAVIIGSLAQGTYDMDPTTGLPMYHTQQVQFIPNLTNNGLNKISLNGDQGMFFSDGKGEEGANENSAFIIAPWAQESEAGDIGGLRMDKYGNVELRGDLRATSAKVDAKWWSDFVFADDYKLRSLAEVEAYIKANKHLPDVPSEADVLENGIDLADMQAIQQQKIEELTLYIIQLQKQIDAMKAQIQLLNK